MQRSDDVGFGTQIRRSPYFDATVRWGAKAFSVYNHMYIPRDFGDPVRNFWNLVNDAILCDVAVERQVEITGPDAARFTQMLTPRDLSRMAIGQCKVRADHQRPGRHPQRSGPAAPGRGPLLAVAGRQRRGPVGAGRRRPFGPGRRDPGAGRLAAAAAGPAVGRGHARALRRGHRGPALLPAARDGSGRHPARRLAHRMVERAGLRGLPAGRLARRRAVGKDHGRGGAPRPEARPHLHDPAHRGRHAVLPRRHGRRHEPVRARARPARGPRHGGRVHRPRRAAPHPGRGREPPAGRADHRRRAARGAQHHVLARRAGRGRHRPCDLRGPLAPARAEHRARHGLGGRRAGRHQSSRSSPVQGGPARRSWSARSTTPGRPSPSPDARDGNRRAGSLRDP